MSLPTIVKDLLASGAELRETHISWVLLGEHDVYKVKKPVHFAFVDFSTLEKREQACRDEVGLNRRLAGDVYLGVVPVTRSMSEPHRLGGEGAVVDWAVHMRRLPDALRADVLLEAGALRAEHVEQLAERIATFHRCARADTDPRGPGAVATLQGHLEENLDALTEPLRKQLGEAGAAALASLHRKELSQRCALLEERRATGRVRDGHGDLRLDHVYLEPEGTVRVLDCVEFDRAFRVADVCADIAFFAMSLRQHQRDDLAEHFLARYALESADHDLYALLTLFETYWALVRAKVTYARLAQLDDAPTKEPQHQLAELIELASRLCSPRAHSPRLIAVGGVIASGKSSLAARIARELACPLLQSDRLRKQLAGLEPTRPLGQGSFKGAYSEAATEQLYAELMRRARVVLESGRSVVVDASFRSAEQRALVRELSASTGARSLCFSCSAPRAALERRLLARARSPQLSDARVDLLDSFLARYAPPQPSEGWVAIDTSGAKAATWSHAQRALTGHVP